MLHRVSILVVAYRLSVAGCGDCGSEGWVFLLDWPFEACFGMFATESVMRCYGAFVFLYSVQRMSGVSGLGVASFRLIGFRV